MNKRRLRSLIVAVFLIIMLLLLKPWVQVETGERGVILDFGAVQDSVLNEGIHFRIPLVQKVILMNVKIQNEMTKVEAFSSDFKKIELSIVISYHLIPSKVNVVYQTIGVEFKEIIIKPSVQEVIKAVLSRYTVMDLITKRPDLIQEIQQTLTDRLLVSNILLDYVSINSLSFSKPFIDTTRTKPTAKEIAITKAERNLKRIKEEVEREFPLQLKNREYGTLKK